MQQHERIEAHYAVPDLSTHIRNALLAAGKSLDQLTPDDLAPFDALHSRGRSATVELAALAAFAPGTRVLDIGSGIGGSARYLASHCGCDVTGVDLTASFCATASELSALVGLSGRTRFQQANALALPFADASFDAVWTEHVQMNVADKLGFYAEIVRVLSPNGRLVFSDIFAVAGQDPYYPTPWADTREESFLVTADELRALLTSLGLKLVHDHDQGERMRAFMTAARERGASASSALGPHVVLRRRVPEKFQNAFRNFEEGRIVSLHAVWAKSSSPKLAGRRS